MLLSESWRSTGFRHGIRCSAAMRVLSPVLTLDLPSRPVGKRNPVCMVKNKTASSHGAASTDLVAMTTGTSLIAT